MKKKAFRLTTRKGKTIQNIHIKALNSKKARVPMDSVINTDITEMMHDIITVRRENLSMIRDTTRIHRDISEFRKDTSEIRQPTLDIDAQNEVINNVTVFANNKTKDFREEDELNNVKMSQELKENEIMVNPKQNNAEEKVQDVVNMIENILTC